MTEAHTPGPWRVEDGYALIWGECDPDDSTSIGMGYPVAECCRSVPRWQRTRLNHLDPDANARRIVAAVNACEGISTDALEAGVVAELVAALRGVDRMVGEATKAPATADRWLDRIEGTAREALAKLGGSA